MKTIEDLISDANRDREQAAETLFEAATTLQMLLDQRDEAHEWTHHYVCCPACIQRAAIEAEPPDPYDKARDERLDRVE